MYPTVKDPDRVGEYPALAKVGGGFVWDDVLEYRVWCYPDKEDHFYYAFADVEKALECSKAETDAEAPLAT